MENLIIILFVLVILKFSLKITLFKNKLALLIVASVAAFYSYLLYPFVIEQNKSDLSFLLSNSRIMINFAVIVCIEAVTGILISIGMLQNLFREKKMRFVKIAKVVPGILIFIALFYLETIVFFYFTGYSFRRVATGYSFVIFAIILLLAYGLKILIPKIDLRYEVKFLINIFILFIGVVISVFYAKYSVVSYAAIIDYKSLLLSISIAILALFSGIIIYKIKLNKKIKKLEKWKL